VQDVKGFEEILKDTTEEAVYLVNELAFCVSSEDVDELIASYSEPMSDEDLVDMQEENKTLPEAEDNDCQSPASKILAVKEMKD
jgi:Mn-dependent DtxR family transcriptional regulator